MAVPSITNIYPNYGYVGGGAMVRILGGDFRTEAGGAYPGELPEVINIIERPIGNLGTGSVRLLFGSAPSPQVVVVNHALIYASVPPAAVPGEVDVTVQNVDLDGDAIPGEVFTLPAGFTYRGADLLSVSAFVRVVQEFIRKMRAEVLQNVTLANVHTDYDASTGDGYNLTELQKLPSITLIGPEILQVRGQPDEVQYLDGFGILARQARPFWGDITFDVIGAADRHRVLINLQAALIQWVERNQFLFVDKDSARPELGKAKFELVFASGGAPSINVAGDENNVSTFVSRLTIKGVPISGLGDFGQEGAGATGLAGPIEKVIFSLFGA
jgi:hypothetical protein